MKHILLSILGFFIAVAAVILALFFPEMKDFAVGLPYVLVGVGAGVFGGNLGSAIAARKLQNNPDMAKQIEIEQKDERNQAVANKAKARTYDLMIYVFAAVLLMFVLMGADVSTTLVLVAVYLFYVGANIYFVNKYHKER